MVDRSSSGHSLNLNLNVLNVTNVSEYICNANPLFKNTIIYISVVVDAKASEWELAICDGGTSSSEPFHCF